MKVIPTFPDKPQEQQQQPQEETPLPESVDLHLTGQNQGGLEDLQISLTGVVDVDDDNLLAPENNVPLQPKPTTFYPTIGGMMEYAFGRRRTTQTPQQTDPPCQHNKR